MHTNRNAGLQSRKPRHVAVFPYNFPPGSLSHLTHMSKNTDILQNGISPAGDGNPYTAHSIVLPTARNAQVSEAMLKVHGVLPVQPRKLAFPAFSPYDACDDAIVGWRFRGISNLSSSLHGNAKAQSLWHRARFHLQLFKLQSTGPHLA